MRRSDLKRLFGSPTFPHSPETPTRGRRWFPALCGLLGFTLVAFVWGSLAKPPVGDDEAAYLLQGNIFASGQVTAAARPLPEFFRQHHVFTQPALAAKYPPGHSLLLTPGIWLGLPGLVPALLVGLTAAVLCSVARRLAGDAVAVLAVLLFATSHIALRFDPSYFSEVSTAFEIVLAWWALFNYWQSAHGAWLMLVAVAIAWCAITRPFTALAFAIPTGIAALVVLRRRSSWRDIVPATVAAVAVFAILPYWNARVTGDWKRLTQSEYARLYMPDDRLGFGTSGTAPAAHLSTDEQRAAESVLQMHEAYTAATLVPAIAARAVNVVAGTWSYHGLPGIAILFAVAALPIAVSRLLVGTVLCVFAAYLAYAHDPTWTLYYLELQAPLAFLTAVGLGRLAQIVGSAAGARRGEATARRIQSLAFGAIVVLLAAPSVPRIISYRRAHADQRQYREALERAIAALPPDSAVVFIPYDTTHGEARLMQNAPNLSAARVWIAHECGSDDARLLAIAPRRRAYTYHPDPVTGAGRLEAFAAAAASGDARPTRVGGC